MNLPVSTTTALLLLSERIDSVEKLIDWIIPMTIGIIAILIALFVALEIKSFSLLRKKEFAEFREEVSGEIADIKKDLRESLFGELDQRQESHRLFVEKELEALETLNKKKFAFLSADTARQFALWASSWNLHAAATQWWVTAASEYCETSNNSELEKTCLSSAREELSSINDRKQAQNLYDKLSEIDEGLKQLEEKYELQVVQLREIIKEKLDLTKKVIEPPG